MPNNCYICVKGFPSIDALLIHYKIKHRFHENSTYRCRENDCNRDFCNLKSYKRHMKLKHAHFIGTVSKSRQSKYGSSTSNVDEIDILNNGGNNDLPHNFVNSDLENLKRTIQQEALIFISKLYNSSLLPRYHVQTIIDFTTEFLNCCSVLSLINFVLTTLRDLNCNIEVLTKLSEAFSVLQNPFANLSTEFLRFKAFETTENLIQPVSYIIGSKYDNKKEQQTMLYKSVDVTGHYIPLRKVFKKFLEIENVFEIVNDYITSLKMNSDGNITNIMQTVFWKNIQQSYDGKVVLPIYLYYDDYETGNPLGSHAGVHKLGGVYIGFGCLPPQYRCLLENIFLALLFHSDDRKEFGTKAVFQILIDELQYLENEGIALELPKFGKITVYFILTLILGDNLGLHSIMGFTESFNSRFFCRFCKVDKQTTHSLPSENPNLLRNLNDYNEDIKLCDVSSSGIKQNCIFNCLSNYHVITNPSVDIMHDMYEGVCQYDMLHILKYLVFTAKLFSIDTLNFRLKVFNYMPGTNKPPLLSADFQIKKRLSLSASEMLCFVRIFSFLIGDLIPKNNDVWKFYRILRHILDIVTSKSLSPGDVNKLQNLISDHHQLYIALFKDTLKPKHHLLVHYPTVMAKVGPLANISSMRFESKHRESKLTANVTSCRKNITRSLSLKHQLKFCFRLMSSKGFRSDIIVGATDFSSNLDIMEHGITGELSTTMPQKFLGGFSVKWVQISGIKYYANSPVAAIFVDSDNLLPVFGTIKRIIVNSSNEICFLYSYLETLGFDEHYHAYQVRETNILKHLEVKEFLELYLLCKLPDGNLYVSSNDVT